MVVPSAKNVEAGFQLAPPAAATGRRPAALRPFGCGEQQHAADVPQLVDLAKELARQTLVHAAAGRVGDIARRERVDVVEKEQARCGATRFLEDVAKRFFG